MEGGSEGGLSGGVSVMSSIVWWASATDTAHFIENAGNDLEAGLEALLSRIFSGFINDTTQGVGLGLPHIRNFITYHTLGSCGWLKTIFL